MMASALALPVALAAGRALAAGANRPSLYDILREPEVLDAAISPSGKQIAVVVRTPMPGGWFTTSINLIDADRPQDPGRRLDLGDMDAEQVAWANDDRLLVWLVREYKVTTSGPVGSASADMTTRRILAIGADGTRPVALFQNRRGSFRLNRNLGNVVDFMPADNDHVLMRAGDYDRGVWALYRVNVYTGVAEPLEQGTAYTYGWRSFGGTPVARYETNNRGTAVTLSVRAPGATEWTAHRRMRVDENGRFDFDIVGSTADPAVVLVLERGDAQGDVVRSFDLRTRQVGADIVRRPAHHLEQVVTDEHGALFASAWWDDRLGYDFADPTLKPIFRAVDAFFEKSCNIRFAGMNSARDRFLLYVSGPTEPGAWFLYDKTAKALEPVGGARTWLTPERLAPMESLRIKARDGQVLTAYVSTPIGAPAGPLPLVVLPHGGPEARDYLDWNDWAQALAAKGWLVLQPNFRGSEGYGAAFTQAGWKRWGDLMQEDVEDCVAHLVAAGRADPARVAIMGASYGGYAALMGAVRRPELYKAAVSIAGVSDLPEMLDWERNTEGGDSPTYAYWRQVIGDPAADQAMLQTASPRRRAAEIAAPVLLIHGKDDDIVPVEQSKIMRDALKKAGKTVDYLEVADMGHNGWKPQQSMTVLKRAIEFLEPRLKA